MKKKIRVKRQNIFIDMTAMSDVTVLLLTFFMLTSTFISKEPIQVVTPSSVSEIKIPETNVMTILVDASGKIFLSLNYQQDMIMQALKDIGKDYGCEFTFQQCENFKKLKSFGIPICSMASFLDLSVEKQDEYMKDLTNPRVGIPIDSVEIKDALGVVSRDNEFARWVNHVTVNNPDVQIAIKADRQTNYSMVKKIMDSLRDMRKNRYLLITNLKTVSE